jgi:hypothetical protein
MRIRPVGHIRQRSSGSWEIRYNLGTNPATGQETDGNGYRPGHQT